MNAAKLCATAVVLASFLTTGLISGAAVGADATNLVANGSFEGSVTGWRGYHGTLSLTSPGAVGAGAAKVSLADNANNFSIYPAEKQVKSTAGGAVYTASASVRSEFSGRQLCVRIREWSPSGAVLGAAARCLRSSGAWQRFEPLSWKALATGNSLDVYVYEWRSNPGDSFEVDEITLYSSAAVEPPPPPDTPTGTPPSNTALPAVSGTPRVGETLSVSLGTWAGSTPMTYAYQWLGCDSAGANCLPLAGATAASYTPTTSNAGSTLRASVTATNAYGSAAARSAATAPVALSTTTTTPVGSLTARSVDHAHVSLSWPSVTGAATFRVVRNGLLVGTTSGTTYTDALLWPQSTYDYRVEALSSSGAVVSTAAVAGATLPLPAAGFPSPFAATSLWNRPLPTNPTLHPNNAAIMSNWVSKYIRTPNMTLHSWGVAVAEAQPSNRAYSVPCTMYSCTLGAFGAFRIPPTARQDPAGDGHLAVYDPVAKREWGMWEAGYSASSDAWTSSAGAAVSLDGDGIAPKGKASANAANFPLLGGLIRPEEIMQGRIDHALVFGQPSIAPGPPVCPATANVATGSDPLSLREGTQLQLDPTLNVDALALPAWQKTVAKALQKYGMYLRDNSGTLAIYAENPISRGYDAWQKVGLSGGSVMFSSAFPWSKLRVIYAPDC